MVFSSMALIFCDTFNFACLSPYDCVNITLLVIVYPKSFLLLLINSLGYVEFERYFE